MSTLSKEQGQLPWFVLVLLRANKPVRFGERHPEVANQKARGTEIQEGKGLETTQNRLRAVNHDTLPWSSSLPQDNSLCLALLKIGKTLRNVHCNSI